ncbi:glycosyltransferase [Azospirillum sp. 11R-A]|uniref:glycosyltransferase n=1 Tax=Azospirillum sp. 11R-A TaxID=3111634 RepID=UPI003C2430FC
MIARFRSPFRRTVTPSMKILFIHPSFPGQFKALAPGLVQRGHTVHALSRTMEVPAGWGGVTVVLCAPLRPQASGVHLWAAEFETNAIHGEALFRQALTMKAEGYVPDVIVAHPGWGDSLFVKDVWPQARLGIYCEYYFHGSGADAGFDPEFPVPDAGDPCRLRLKNAANLLQFEIADAGLSPTRWQADGFPSLFRDRITVVHDGIDTGAVAPNPDARAILNGTFTLTRADEVVTFVNRTLEPYRGYHSFMRALPRLLARRPRANVLIVGGAGVTYGTPPPSGSWRDIFIDEVRGSIPDADWSRVFFLGNIPYDHFIPLLQLSSVHVYLSYPFVLSWSVMEAMSAGAAVVGSNTAPVREVIEHDRTGRLVDFFDHRALADTVADLLADRAARDRLGAEARAFIRANHDLHTVCLPRQFAWIDELADGRG